jgi:hypothetical protein
MSSRHYRLTVIGCALAWFLLGAHLPVLHQVTHHGRSPSWTAVLAVVAVMLAALAGVVVLLRAPNRSGSAGAAT